MDRSTICGNATTHVQKVTVVDTTPPVLTGVPDDVTAGVRCHQCSPVATVTGSDNCDANVQVTFTETKIDGACPDSYTLVRSLDGNG
ncbi:MAG: hypothetical protein R2787_00235 [Saprospiraceae bacterium]